MDQLVSFETANLAEQKGFDEVCQAAYRKDENNLQLFDSGCSSQTLAYFYVLAPTQTALARWLREVHGTSIELHFGMRGCGPNYLGWYHADIHGPYGGGLATTVNYTKTDTYPNENLTYEQCLEKCLLEALKLINNGSSTR